MIERKITAWQAAGLIDAETAARIREHEARTARPLALWAVIGIGVLTIGLGLVSVVAANWEAIPGTTRLALHFALMAVLAGVVWWRGEELAQDRPWVQEALIFVLAMLGLTFFGHLGQVYQTSSPLWQPLSVWLLLFAPLILMRGQSWLLAAQLMAVLVYACVDFAIGEDDFLLGSQRNETPILLTAASLALPTLLAPLGAWMRGRSARTDFWRRIEQLGFAYALLAGSLFLVMASINEFPDRRDGPVALGIQVIQGCIGLAAAALVAISRPNASGRASALVIAVASVALVLADFVSGSTIGAGVAFLALWAVVAAAAQMGGWRGVFQFAVAVIAVRLIVLSFELASDLLTSGAGLIMAGLLILGVAWVAVRVSRQYAPSKDDEVVA